MHWISRKIHIFTLLFLFHYAIYVVSPLMHSREAMASDEGVVAHERSAVSNLSVNIFFLELICQGLDNDNDGDIDNDASTVKILVKRPRAVLRKDVNVKVASSESFAYHENGLPILFYSSSRPILPGDEQIPPGYISPFYSGHSPPA